MKRCAHGHTLSGENLTPSGKCRKCRQAACNRYRDRKRKGLGPVGRASGFCRNGHDVTLPGAVSPTTGKCRRCDRANWERRRRRLLGYEPAPLIVCGRKFCPHCGIWRHLVYFPLYRLRATGELKRSAHCDACHRAKARANHAATKADPVRHERMKEVRRFANDRYNRSRGVPARRWRPPKNRKSLLPRAANEFLPAGPFLQWWEAWQAANPLETPDAFLAGAGFDLGIIRKAYERGVIHLDFVDKALVQGREPPTTLLALYPFEGSSECSFLPPLPVPEPLRIRSPRHSKPDDWAPPKGMFAPDELARLRRMRVEVAEQQHRISENFHHGGFVTDDFDEAA